MIVIFGLVMFVFAVYLALERCVVGLLYVLAATLCVLLSGCTTPGGIYIEEGFPWPDGEILHAIDLTVGDRDLELAAHLHPRADNPRWLRWCGLTDGYYVQVSLHPLCTDGTLPPSALVHEIEHCTRQQIGDRKWYVHSDEFLWYVDEVNTELTKEAQDGKN
jgi:hypothetical protein